MPDPNDRTAGADWLARVIRQVPAGVVMAALCAGVTWYVSFRMNEERTSQNTDTVNTLKLDLRDARRDLDRAEIYIDQLKKDGATIAAKVESFQGEVRDKLGKIQEGLASLQTSVSNIEKASEVRK